MWNIPNRLRATANTPESLAILADANLFTLGGNSYPGRGIVVGLDETGNNLVQVYWIMGRSENSRNRIFSTEGGRLFTEAAHPSKVKDPSLIIYNAMFEVADQQGETISVVSNGHQTDDVAEGFLRGQSFYEVMRDWSYEPDKPNFTPRITATSSWLGDNETLVEIALLRKSPWSDACDRHLYEINDIDESFGYCLTTYSGDGDPLPSFHGEPYLLSLRGDADQIAGTFWEVLNAENRVSLAVKFIPKIGASRITIINKYSKIG